MSAPLSDLRDAVAAASGAVAGGDGHALGAAHARAPRRRPASATTPRTRRCCSRRAPASPPREVAGRLAEELEQRLGAALERVEIAGPGFLNLFMSDAWCVAALGHVLAAGDGFGGGGADPAENVNVEFVSANPTGPMTAAGARHAAYGDSLARLLEFRGHAVTREYYINDIGGQVQRLGESIRARARGEDVPEGGYEGDYVRELAERIPGAGEDDLDGRRRARHLAAAREDPRVDARDRRRLRRLVLRGDAARRRGLEGATTPSRSSRERGETYRSEGALWLRTSAHGEPKDDVLERSTGEPSYFASDIAYHLDKRERGFDRLIDVLGRRPPRPRRADARRVRGARRARRARSS